MKLTKSLLVAAMLLNTTMASAAFVVTNTKFEAPYDQFGGANGDVYGSFPSFTLMGSNSWDNLSNWYGHPVGGYITTYTDTFAIDTTVKFNYTAGTNDSGGFHYDQVGYLVNDTFTKLSPSPYFSEFFPEPVSGSVMVSVLAGQRFGFYARSNDNSAGAIYLRVNAELSPSAVPVPTALPLMASALGIFGLARRRNKSKAA